jgi:hypothetical protein
MLYRTNDAKLKGLLRKIAAYTLKNRAFTVSARPLVPYVIESDAVF